MADPLETVAATDSGLTPESGPGSARTRRAVEPGMAIGRYVVQGILGKGAMGVVYEAFDPELERTVAIKQIASPREGEARSRLLAEARAMAAVAHPNVVTVVDVAEFEGDVCVAMELVPGVTLRRWLETETRSKAEILRVFAAAGSGIVALHEAGLVHRDLKPDNIMVTGGRVVVMDLGLAVESGELDEGSGRFAGTPAYMSPEQFAGEEVDARSDQYSFATALYEALFDERPFAGETIVQLASAVVLGELRPVPHRRGVHRRVRAALKRALSRDPHQRFETVAAMLDAMASPSRGGLLLGGVVAGSIMVPVLGWWATERPATCDDPDEALSAAWNETMRQEIAVAFAAAEPAYIRERHGMVEQRLDEFAARWREGYAAACVDVAAEKTGADRQMYCLQQQKARLAGVVGGLREANEDGLDEAARAVGRLDPTTSCESTRQVVPEAADRALILQLIEIDAMFDAGQSEGALAALAAVPSDGSPSEAVAWRIERVRGSAARAAGEFTTAVDAYSEAHYGARATGADAPALEMAASVAGLYANRIFDQELAERWRREVEAGLASTSHTPADLRVSAMMAIGAVHSSRGESKKAREVLGEGVAIAKEQLPSGALLHAKVTNQLGGALYAEQEWALALDAYASAVELFGLADGRGHPDRALALGNLANVLSELGRHEESLEAHDESISLAGESFGPLHPQTLVLRMNLVEARVKSGDFATAQAEIRAVYPRVEASFGNDHAYSVYGRSLAKQAQAGLDAK